ncbi:MAG: ATP-binding protein, partial [Flavobacteriales bacterium]|nr:ATP-binding protein [Flavobacteriales bacterium]
MSTKSVQNKTINFPSLAENIALVEGWVDNLCVQHNVGEDHYGNILIAVTEAVTNAIQHGNKQDPTKNVDVTIDVEESKIAFMVKDQGEGFNFDDLPDPTDPE